MSAETDSAINLSKAALQYGPFLFAILFIVFVPPYAHAIWRRSLNGATGGDAENSLLNESRLYFRYSWMFGFLLVACSILWWGYAEQIAIIRSTQYIAYTGVVTGLSPEDQLLSINQDDNEYLVPGNMSGISLYRFVYLSHMSVDNPIDLYISYLNTKIAPASLGNGYQALQIPLKFKPGKTNYKFVTDEIKGAMIVPQE
jgi:hypothetical protein